MVLGHDNVGNLKVSRIGESVKEFAFGDVVNTHKICGPANVRKHYGVHNLRQLGRVRFFFKIPQGLVPLMCGGATIFFEVIESDSHNIHFTDRVVIGDLEHITMRFLAKMGVSIVVFSSTLSKRESH
ncbi:hypothetical protein B0H15DRAFT_929931 [Mycena belliarum]|uniref:Uncharacterized protein n=1 Tax=Mycena belliarum TaxID=1033014 RepID=A0AAD6XNN5_9AGAR|nr:hypothetical protein B0H15DRAFT_929931 [Mycena belliae]